MLHPEHRFTITIVDELLHLRLHCFDTAGIGCILYSIELTLNYCRLSYCHFVEVLRGIQF